ncbi:MAG: type IIL restriction-modification enzyme MmeI, partial [Methylococcaceae bacterium]
IMHMAWMRTVCGRMKSDYQYSASVVYNNFPFPIPTDKQIKLIEEKAQIILNVRLDYNNSTLADLYNPLTMPPTLVKAHNELDKAVDLAYNYKGNKDDASRVAFLFTLYQTITAPILPKETVKKPRKTKQDNTL